MFKIKIMNITKAISRSKTKKYVKSSLVVALALLLSMSMYAQYGQGRHGERQGQRERQGERGNFLEMLELSEEQEAKIEDLRLSHLENMLTNRNELDEKKAKLNSLSTEKTVDMKAINSLIEEIGTLKTEMMKEKEAHHQEIRKILTDEQRIKFDLHRSNRGGKGRGHGNGNMHCR